MKCKRFGGKLIRIRTALGAEVAHRIAAIDKAEIWLVLDIGHGLKDYYFIAPSPGPYLEIEI